jgi:hypothetical protein
LSDEGKQLECVADQFGLRRLYPRDRLFSGQGQRAACAVHPSARRSPYAADVAEPLPGCCEFATGIIFEGSESRTCSITDWSFCSAKFFKDSHSFEKCSARKEKLAAEQR